MKRRTLDIIFAGGGLLVAVILVALGFALLTQYTFAQDYVKEELSSACLVTYAGQTMQTGPQAECYAKYYLAEHMDASAKNAGFPGATYATLGGIRSGLSADIAAAKAKGDTTGAADLQKKLDSATSLRTTMQTGETLRGLLLTVYGFSAIGEKAGLAANIIFGLAGLMALLSIAGFAHAFITPKEKVVFAPTGGVTKARMPI